MSPPLPAAARPLSAADRRRLVDLYEGRFARHGRSLDTLGWTRREDQHLRFEVLCDVGDLSGSTVCDFGCGFGDLWPFLAQRYRDLTYTGIDLAPSLVRQAAADHPDAEFLCLDVLEHKLPRRFDHVLASGVLSLKVDDNLAWSLALLQRLFAAADRGVAVNFLSTHATYRHAHNHHYDPRTMLEIGRSLTPHAAVRADYPLHEFTLYLRHEPAPVR